MNIENFDTVTRCRAILVISSAILDNNIFLYDDSFIHNLHDFYYTKTLESNRKRKDLFLIQHTIKIGKKRIAAESQLTVDLLETLLTDIDFNKNYTDLLDTLTPEQVDLVSNLSTEYVEFINKIREAKKNIRRLTIAQ